MACPALCLGLLLLALGGAQAKVRGVRPELADKYTGGDFGCLDGSKQLSWSQVNDNYCDCADGSDEPGTAACPNGVFYCRNRGHEAKIMSTSFVDDGVCDCCDGSDELAGCTNTCIEKNAAVREQLKQKVADYKAALDQRASYIAQAPALRDEMAARQGAMDGLIADKEQEVKELQAESARLAEEEANAPPPPPPPPAPVEDPTAALAAAAAAEAAAAVAAHQAAHDTEPEPATEAEKQAMAYLASARATNKAEGGEAQEETAEERGRRIAAQWTSDPEAAGAPAGAKSAQAPAGVGAAAKGGWLGRTLASVKDAAAKISSAVTGAEDDASVYDPVPASEVGGEGDDMGEAGEDMYPPVDGDYPGFDADHHDHHHTYAQPVEEPPAPPTPAQEAAERLRAAEAELQALKDEKELLARQVGYDYGPEAQWLALRNRCLEAREPQYAYRACLFDRAAQVDINGGHETNLGQWVGFENSYTEAVFEGGDWCYQAPNRSLRIKIHCTQTESSWSASEPSTCVYVSNVGSPVACNQAGLAYLQDQLATLLAEEAALRAEIEADEKERAAAEAAKDEL